MAFPVVSRVYLDPTPGYAQRRQEAPALGREGAPGAQSRRINSGFTRRPISGSVPSAATATAPTATTASGARPAPSQNTAPPPVTTEPGLGQFARHECQSQADAQRQDDLGALHGSRVSHGSIR